MQIFGDLAGNDDALAALLDVHGDVGFVVDTTGSMGDEIALVKVAIQGIVGIYGSAPATALLGKPDAWLLETFNDPTYDTAPFVTPDPNKLLSAVTALTVGGWRRLSGTGVAWNQRRHRCR